MNIKSGNHAGKSIRIQIYVNVHDGGRGIKQLKPEIIFLIKLTWTRSAQSVQQTFGC